MPVKEDPCESVLSNTAYSFLFGTYLGASTVAWNLGPGYSKHSRKLRLFNSLALISKIITNSFRLYSVLAASSAELAGIVGAKAVIFFYEYICDFNIIYR